VEASPWGCLSQVPSFHSPRFDIHFSAGNIYLAHITSDLVRARNEKGMGMVKRISRIMRCNFVMCVPLQDVLETCVPYIFT